MKKWMYRVSKFAPAALLVAGVLVAGEAGAQNKNVGCSNDNPTMVCPLEQCMALQDQVKAPDSCSTPESPLDICENIKSCTGRQDARNRWQKCFETRTTINNVCFSGGDLTHRIEASRAQARVSDCDLLMSMPPPFGCDKKNC
jgi:hypothetical protein